MQATADNNGVTNDQGGISRVSAIEAIQTVGSHVRVQPLFRHQGRQHAPGHGRAGESQVAVAEATENAWVSRNRTDVRNGVG